ncbi:hypothetical protein IOU02_001902 [Listeria monocytogenes]|nr:hypothetical protein [Listeria monocytogenes]
MEKKKNLILDNGLGLIGVSETKMHMLVKASKSEKMKNHIRLLSLAKVNKVVY